MGNLMLLFCWQLFILLGVRSAIHFGILFGDEWKDFLFFEGL
jgi:hypothetical protein